MRASSSSHFVIRLIGGLLVALGLAAIALVVAQRQTVPGSLSIRAWGQILLFEVVSLGLGSAMLRRPAFVVETLRGLGGRQLAVNLALLFATLCLCVALLEGALLFVPPKFSDSQLFGWDSLRNADQRRSGGNACGDRYPVRFQTTARGYRREVGAGSGLPRILVLGDSYTEAQEVSRGEEYFAFLDELPGVELFVKGVGGWGTLQEYLFVDRSFEEIRPDIILLQFCSNDFVNNHYGLERRSVLHNNGRRRPYLEGDRIVYRNAASRVSQLGSMRSFRLLEYYSKALRTMLANLRIRLGSSRANLSQRITHEPEAVAGYAEAIETTSRILGRLRARSQGTRLLAFYAEAPGLDTRDAFERVMRSNDIPIVPGVRAATAQAACPYDRDGVHWSREGHRAAAGALQQYFEQNLKELYTSSR